MSKFKLHRRISGNGRIAVGGTMVLLLILVAVFGPIVAGSSLYSFDLAARLSASSARHLLGCDDFGRICDDVHPVGCGHGA